MRCRVRAQLITPRAHGRASTTYPSLIPLSPSSVCLHCFALNLRTRREFMHGAKQLNQFAYRLGTLPGVPRRQPSRHHNWRRSGLKLACTATYIEEYVRVSPPRGTEGKLWESHRFKFLE